MLAGQGDGDGQLGDFTDGFHLFALEWEPGAIRWFVDGVQYQELKEWTTPGAAFPAPFDQSFYLVLNLAVGGGFVGPVDEGTHFPAQFVADYVRVLQRRSSCITDRVAAALRWGRLPAR